MYIRRLVLNDFRSWPELDLDLTPGVTVLVGRNGHGKTNVVEAIGYVAHLNSHRVSNDAPLVRSGQEHARISATAVNDGRELTAHLLLKAKGANRASLNRTAMPSPRDIMGVVRTVLFAPEDLALVRGEPGVRRAWLDEVIAMRTPRLAGVKAEYDKVLKQRTALLKTAQAALRKGYRDADGASALATLDVWDGHLAHLGAQVIAARVELLGLLHEHIVRAYHTLAPESRPARLEYLCSVELPTEFGSHKSDALGADALDADADDSSAAPATKGKTADATRADATRAGATESGVSLTDTSLVEAAMLAQLGQMRSREIDRGMTLVGPHRDDVGLYLGAEPAKGFASHGETWSYALAMRLGVFELLKGEGTAPILILDDVFAELDARRRRALVQITKEAEQVLITAAVAEDLPENLHEGVSITTHTVTAVDGPEGRHSVIGLGASQLQGDDPQEVQR